MYFFCWRMLSKLQVSHILILNGKLSFKGNHLMKALGIKLKCIGKIIYNNLYSITRSANRSRRWLQVCKSRVDETWTRLGLPSRSDDESEPNVIYSFTSDVSHGLTHKKTICCTLLASDPFILNEPCRHLDVMLWFPW